MSTNNTINTPLIIPTARGGTGVASPAANTLPIGNGSSALTFQGPMTSGQLQIGSTGAAPVLATITAGTGMSVTNAAGSITLATTGAAANLPLTIGSSATLVPNTRYLFNNLLGGFLTLPATSAVGDVIQVILGTATITQVGISQTAGQSIYYSGVRTSVGFGGSLALPPLSSITLFCAVANLTWIITDSIVPAPSNLGIT